MFNKIATIMIAAAFLTACAGEQSKKVSSLQKRDKTLTCAEVQLEINEAEYYRSAAEKNKAPDIKSLIMPVGYISTYMNAQDAVKAANERVDYLNRIYDIRKCDEADLQKARSAQVQPRTNYMPAQYANPAPYVSSQYQAPAYYQPMSMQQMAPLQDNIYYNNTGSNTAYDYSYYW